MAVHNEVAFEVGICEYLEAHGWLYSPTGVGYDVERALYPPDVFAWLQESQPEQWAKTVPADATAAQRKAAEQGILTRLRKTLDATDTDRGGTLGVLRHGFQYVKSSFVMGRAKPATTLTPRVTEQYGSMRLRVMRQVHYSVNDSAWSIDLVLFVNGIPVATCELKTDMTQSLAHAIRQYQHDRLPRPKKAIGSALGRQEPLLTPLSGAVVHFAVSNDRVAMTTRLAGAETRFLPFDMGDAEGAGNPLNPGGSRTAYLWEEIWDREAWIDILLRFVHIETKKRPNAQGKLVPEKVLIFPRYHQWRAVTKMITASRTEGPGQRYLIQHSAGSGKTRTIAWTAHRLATLHDDDNEKVFDTVIVVSDRTVLDDQLREAVKQIETTTGMVTSVTAKDAAAAGFSSKSGLLGDALTSGAPILSVTLQTFPFVLKALDERPDLASRRFAVIADEAHSSQTGQTAQKLKEVLTSEQLAELAESGEVEIDTETILAARTAGRAHPTNISFYAFTATPKRRTMELFGRPDPDGLPVAFDTYSMKQAIQEGYILNVLANYLDYDTAFRLHENDRQKTPDATPVGQRLVDKGKATSGLIRWVKLHPTNIAQKVGVIVEHFRVHVAWRLEGQARAMVVTDSRLAAVRYKKALDAYIAEHHYPEATALVAFSGEVTDGPEGAEEKYTETSMNPGLKGRSLPEAFDDDQGEYRVLIVANKYQTGFDQPKLSALYVDKLLNGVAAVQTLSRLNRTYTRGQVVKTAADVFVLDFVNKPDDIADAFRPYYTDVHIAHTTDPDAVHDLWNRIAAQHLFDQDDIDTVVAVALSSELEKVSREVAHNMLHAALDPTIERFQVEMARATERQDSGRVEELVAFRGYVKSWVRLYDFISQVIDYQDTGLEKRGIFLRMLDKKLRLDDGPEMPNLDGVELVHIATTEKAKVAINIGDPVDIPGGDGTGAGKKRDPEYVLLSEILDLLNEEFGGDITPEQGKAFIDTTMAQMTSDQNLVAQATHNTRDQFLTSPDLATAITLGLLAAQDLQQQVQDKFQATGTFRDRLLALFGQIFFEQQRVDSIHTTTPIDYDAAAQADHQPRTSRTPDSQLS